MRVSSEKITLIQQNHRCTLLPERPNFQEELVSSAELQVTRFGRPDVMTTNTTKYRGFWLFLHNHQPGRLVKNPGYAATDLPEQVAKQVLLGP